MKTILFRDSKWLVQFETPDTGFTPDEITFIKDKYTSELVLKQGNVLYFLEEIPELMFTEIGRGQINEVKSEDSL